MPKHLGYTGKETIEVMDENSMTKALWTAFDNRSLLRQKAKAAREHAQQFQAVPVFERLVKVVDGGAK